MKYKLQSYLHNPRSKGCVSNGYSNDRQQITYMSDFLQQARVSRHRAPATPSVKSAKRPPQLRGFPVCLSNNPVDARCVTNLSTFVQTKRLPLAAGRKTAPSAWRHPVCKGVRGRKSPSGRGRHRWWAGRCEGTRRAGPPQGLASVSNGDCPPAAGFRRAE